MVFVDGLWMDATEVTNEYFERFVKATGYVTVAEQRPSWRHPLGPKGSITGVHRGGSFLCTDQYCSRYVVGTCGKGDVSNPTNHLGFRLVKAL